MRGSEQEPRDEQGAAEDLGQAESAAAAVGNGRPHRAERRTGQPARDTLIGHIVKAREVPMPRTAAAPAGEVRSRSARLADGVGRLAMDYARLEPRRLKTSDRVALDIVRDIVSNGLQTGDQLPGEAAMLDQYRVARASLREALRLLEVQGLVTLRRGPGGGPFVGAVDARNLARTATLYFHLAGATYHELFDAWQLTEPLLARKAALNPDREAVRGAIEPHLSHPDGTEQPVYIATSTDFHRVIAELAGNRVLFLMVQAIGAIVIEHILAELNPVTMRETIDHDHTDIARAILDGRADDSQALMTQHIDHVAGFYLKHWPGRLDDPIQWR